MTNYFAKNLKYLREKKKIDQQVLAENLRVPQSTLACWESGIRTPKISKIQEIATYFDVNMDIISKDYTIEDDNINNELDELLFSKAKELSDEDKKMILNIINAIKREVDKEENSD